MLCLQFPVTIVVKIEKGILLPFGDLSFVVWKLSLCCTAKKNRALRDRVCGGSAQEEGESDSVLGAWRQMSVFTSPVSLAVYGALLVLCIFVSSWLLQLPTGRDCILFVLTLALAQYPGTVRILTQSGHKVLWLSPESLCCGFSMLSWCVKCSVSLHSNCESSLLYYLAALLFTTL